MSRRTVIHITRGTDRTGRETNEWEWDEWDVRSRVYSVENITKGRNGVYCSLHLC